MIIRVTEGFIRKKEGIGERRAGDWRETSQASGEGAEQSRGQRGNKEKEGWGSASSFLRWGLQVRSRQRPVMMQDGRPTRVRAGS